MIDHPIALEVSKRAVTALDSNGYEITPAEKWTVSMRLHDLRAVLAEDATMHGALSLAIFRLECAAAWLKKEGGIA